MVTVFVVCAFRILIGTKIRGRRTPVVRLCMRTGCSLGTNGRRKRCGNGFYVTVADLKTANRGGRRRFGLQSGAVFSCEIRAKRITRFTGRPDATDPKFLDHSSGQDGEKFI